MRAADPRWIALTTDGRYTTLGRHRAPEEVDVERVRQAMQAAGLSGWLAVMSQSVHDDGMPEFVEVRPLGRPGSSFEQAVAALLSRRDEERQQAGES